MIQRFEAALHLDKGFSLNLGPVILIGLNMAPSLHSVSVSFLLFFYKSTTLATTKQHTLDPKQNTLLKPVGQIQVILLCKAKPDRSFHNTVNLFYFLNTHELLVVNGTSAQTTGDAHTQWQPNPKPSKFLRGIFFKIFLAYFTF